MAPESERANCPTSKRTGVGDCGEDMRINGVHHSCKLADDHEGAHECDCSPDSWRERRVQELEKLLGEAITFIEATAAIGRGVPTLTNLPPYSEWREQIRKGAKHE